MFLYENKSVACHPVYQWNSVDLLTENGLFQHGEVIDVAENGLIVDFRCSGQRAQFVNYDNIFLGSLIPCCAGYSHCNDELRRHPKATENARVEVLCRSQPGAAWLWYPGRLLSEVRSFLMQGIPLVIAEWERTDGFVPRRASAFAAVEEGSGSTSCAAVGFRFARVSFAGELLVDHHVCD
ncbi:uncharacterized protein LOC129595489 [Paramacrobiotus metropolitanus]|uniref:uncharacterized protein LOC129595489 n=1 Tax=Paramacrobiotus metropolitanus TaxID=2943436 RepID=UPI00244585B7|nr:uncharacterized protein LOC129595489 [Paramacrobiotus metropolitanus]